MLCPSFQVQFPCPCTRLMPHTSGCDEGLPKERIINKRRTQTVLDIVSLQHSSNSAWLGGFVSVVCPLPRHWRFPSALSSPHRSTALFACPPTTIRFRFFDTSDVGSKDFLSHCILSRITVCTAKKRVLLGPRDVDCDSAHAATTLSLPVVAFEMLGSM